MAFQSLMSGADCAVAVNPLHQVLKHSERDQSLQKDRVAGPSNARLQYLPSSSQSTANPADLQMARQFFNNGRQELQTTSYSQHVIPYISPAEFESLPQSQSAPFRTKQIRDQMLKSQAWAAEFSTSSSPTQRASPAPQQAISQSLSQVTQHPYYQQNYGYGTSPYSQTYTSNYIPTSLSKGKGKLTEADFDAAFASFDQEVTVDDLDGLEAAFEKQTIEDKGKGKALDDRVDFQRVWDELQDSEMPPSQSEMAKWESEFNQMMDSQRDDMEDFGAEMEEQYRRLTGEDSALDNLIQFDEDGIPQLGEYVFEQNNPFIEHPSALARAKELLASNGSLSEAALLLEAAIQQNDLGEGGYEAWILLGETHSMDEREEAAIRALDTGVQRAQKVGESAAGRVSLAIAYTNEGYEKASYSMLLRWLKARYPEFIGPEGQTSGELSTWALKERVTDGYLNAARQQHAGGIVDPDVQVGLGVLLYTAGDYERAADCFSSALQARPQDYLLWNRYGSCLSNNNKPEEALGAYREALNIRPTYTRAVYNVGVACLNIGAHKEAAEHLLSGLDNQLRVGDSTSDQLWTTLRRCLINLDRSDLVNLARPGTQLGIFKDLGFEF